MAKNTFKRKELKYRLNKKQYERFKSEIMPFIIPDEYCIDGKNYGIYNLYYDTGDSYLIRTSLSKPYFKEKLRLRSYQSPTKSEDNVFLEIKRKIGGIVTKRRVLITLKQAEAFLKTNEIPVNIDNVLQKQVFREIQAFINLYTPKPMQYISYQREAYFAKDDKELRITFDKDIYTRRDDLSLRSENYGSNIINSEERLLEIKVSSAMPLWLVHALSNADIFKISFSKYGTAYNQYLLSNEDNEENQFFNHKYEIKI